MTWKTGLAIFGGLLGIICGEALKLGYTDWSQLAGLQYWLGIGVQTASLIGVYVGGLYREKPTGTGGGSVDLRKITTPLIVALLGLALLGCKTAAPRHDTTVNLQVVVSAVTGFQAAEKTLYDAQTLPALTADRHQAINAKLSQVWTALDSAAATVQAWTPGQPIPPQVAPLFQKVTALLGDVTALVSPALSDKLTAILNTLAGLLATFGGAQ